MQNNTNDYQPVTLTPEMQAKAAELIENLNADPEFIAALDARRESEEARFCIDSESAADWLLRKLANIEAEKARVKVWAKNRTAELDSDAARLNHLFGDQLKAWGEQEAERRRRKTVTLPNGDLCFRTENPRLILADEAAARAHAETVEIPEGANALIRTRAELDTAAYREMAEQHFAETGDLWPGIVRTEKQEAFSIQFLKPAREGKGSKETAAPE